MNHRFAPALALLAACTAAPPPSPAPSPAADTVAQAPPAPGPTLEERWRAPFAVQASGRVAERPARPPVVRLAPADSAAPAPRDTARAAPVIPTGA